jgi:hypothetical protein
MSQRHATLLLGSSRKRKNTMVFATSLSESLERRGYSTEFFHSIDAYVEIPDIMLDSLKGSEMLCVLTPLYSDFLPYTLIKTLEELSDKYRDVLRGKSLFGFSQCAFPFWRLNEASLKSIELFGKENGMNWLGGIAYGGAGMMDCKHLSEMGSKGEKMMKGFDMAVSAMAEGKKIPEECQAEFELNIPGMLKRPVCWMINKRIRKMERETGKHFEDRPYA